MKKIKQPAPADSYPAFRRLTQAHTQLDAPNFGCGIALGCGRLEMGPTWDQDQWEDVIFAALPSEAVVELLSCDAGRLDGERQAERRSEFVPWLGLHPDARLRAAAAAETQISPVLVRMLAADPAYEVRRQLSQNVEAVSVMKPDLVVKFAAVFFEHALFCWGLRGRTNFGYHFGHICAGVKSNKICLRPVADIRHNDAKPHQK